MNEDTGNPNVTKITIAIISTIGVIVAAYIGYSATIKSASLPIEATQTAEAIRTAVALTNQDSVPAASNTSVHTINPSETPIQFIFPVQTSIPTLTMPPVLPTQEIIISIRELAFCEHQFIDEVNSKCKLSQQIFAEGIKQIYVSWVYLGSYSGEYSRMWYRNGSSLGEFTRSDRVWGLDGQRDYTFVSYRNGFIAGEYVLEFRINLDNRLIYSASFTVH